MDGIERACAAPTLPLSPAPPHPQNAILAHPHPEADTDADGIVRSCRGRNELQDARHALLRPTSEPRPHRAPYRPPAFRLTRSVLRAYRPKAPIPASYAASPSA
jgi:hypothetical protein